MREVTDKDIYSRARWLFESENPGRRFIEGPVIRPGRYPSSSGSALQTERDRYAARARDELAAQRGATVL